MGEPITFMEPSTSVWLLSWPGCTEYIRCGSSCVPAVSPRLGCRGCPRAMVALFTCVCSSYTCARCTGWGAAASLHNFWLRQCCLALRPRLCWLASRIASCEVPLLVFMRELVLCPVFIPVASALVAQQDTARNLVVVLRSVAKVAIFSPNPRFSR